MRRLARFSKGLSFNITKEAPAYETAGDPSHAVNRIRRSYAEASATFAAHTVYIRQERKNDKRVELLVGDDVEIE